MIKKSEAHRSYNHFHGSFSNKFIHNKIENNDCD